MTLSKDSTYIWQKIMRKNIFSYKWNLYHKPAYLYNMKKTKNLIVRITESQFKKLSVILVTEQKSKSAIVREALDNYMDGSKGRTEKQNQWNNINKKTLQ